MQPVYNAPKGFLRLLTKSSAIENASQSIRVKSAHPGPIVPQMTESMRRDPEQYEFNLARVPMGLFVDVPPCCAVIPTSMSSPDDSSGVKYSAP